MKKSEQAYERIKEMIVDGELTGDTIYSENQMSDILGVSRTPIRDAIRMLETEGYAEVYRGLGFRVRSITVKEMYELYPLRYLLECYAMRTAIGKIPQSKYEEMIGRWRELRLLAQEGTDIRKSALQEADRDTHDLFIQYAGNGTLRQLVDILEIKIRRFRTMSADITNDDLDTIDQHIDILTHMRQGDLDTSLQLMQQHMHRPWEKLFQEAGLPDEK